MRVLHLVASVGQYSGGLGPTALGLAYAQQALGCEVAVWCLDSPEQAVQATREWGANVPILTMAVVGPAAIGYSPAAERMASSEAGARYDVLHQHSIWMANSRVTNCWRTAFRCPTVISPHGALNEYARRRSRWKKWLAWQSYEGENLRLASCLMHTAEPEAESFRKYGLTNPMACVPNGVSDAWLESIGSADRFRQQHAIPPNKRLLLFLSRVHPIKGLPLLFGALASLRQRMGNWCLVIAGPDEVGHRRELELLAQKLDIDDRVQFIGPLSGSDKRDAFAAADVFVLPTHSENFAIVVAEALGTGVPVITTHGAPWQELQTNQCGWWVGVNTNAIREALQDALARSPDELCQMGRRGRELVERRYTWARAAQMTVDVYAWLLGRREQPDCVITGE